jgi:cobalt-zinc-cadmium efflux system membrane fusion protein
MKNAFFIAIAAISMTISCTHKQEEAKEEKFEVTDSLINSMLIDTVQQADRYSEMTLTGSIDPDEDKMAKIYPMVSGIVRNVHVQLGDVVHKGQLLATMSSAEIAGFASAAVSSAAELSNAKKAASVTEDMFKSGLVSQRELEQTKNDLQKAIAENQRSQTVMGLNPVKGNAYEVKAPITGFITEKNITSNMQVRADNATNLFTVADLSTVWAMVNVYESDISKIHEGDATVITTLSYPDKVFNGKIDKIYSMLDADNKVMRARVQIDNKGYLLKPGMFANVRINTSSGDKLPVINTRSLIFDNNQYYVIVVDGSSKVHIQPVDIGRKVEDKAYISKGLKPGDRIIASRQVFMYQSLND